MIRGHWFTTRFSSSSCREILVRNGGVNLKSGLWAVRLMAAQIYGILSPSTFDQGVWPLSLLGPQTPENITLVLVAALCCCCLQILHHFWKRNPAFHFALGPTPCSHEPAGPSCLWCCETCLAASPCRLQAVGSPNSPDFSHLAPVFFLLHQVWITSVSNMFLKSHLHPCCAFSWWKGVSHLWKSHPVPPSPEPVPAILILP